jgi:hypothetical protein
MTEEQAKRQADCILNFLAGVPSGNAVADGRAVVRQIMLQTGGTMMACGDYFNVKSKSLGGGVYNITLERRMAVGA